MLSRTNTIKHFEEGIVMGPFEAVYAKILDRFVLLKVWFSTLTRSALTTVCSRIIVHPLFYEKI